MKRVVTVSKAQDLNPLLDLIHDQKFDKDAIVFDPKTSVLTIPFCREKPEDRKLLGTTMLVKRWSVPVVESLLRIETAEQFHIDDPANIGIYEFNSVKYDERRHEILLTAEPRFSLRVEVKELKITAEDTPNVLKRKTSYSI